MISPLNLARLATCCGAAAPLVNVSFTSVSTDSRTLQKGDLFVALRGEFFDGQHFLKQVTEQGACAAVVEESCKELALPQLVVDNTVKALGQLGALNREQFAGPVVGITGSSGKTTVKEMVAAILKTRGEVLATRGNLNNHIGVPLMLLQINAGHHYAVIEMGASALGEIAYLAKLAQPHVSVITNVGTAHVGGFGSTDNIAKGKGEIYEALGSDGIAVVNRDDSYNAQWLAQNKNRKVLTFSCQHAADVMAKNIQADATSLFSFVLCIKEQRVDVRLALIGEHNVINALAAAACCLAIGIDIGTIKQGLEMMQPVSGRMQYKAGPEGLAVIDDTYNANPGSVRAAIDALKGMRGTRVLVLGDMAELGERSEQLHREIGAYAKAQGIDVLLTVGHMSQHSTAAFGSGASHCTQKSEVIMTCKKFAGTSTVVLVKGSRSSRMEEVVNGLLNDFSKKGAASC